MSRLTKWVNGEVWYYTKDDHFPAREMDGYESLIAMNKLAHYEDLEEQGRLIELPCLPNEEVWIGHRIYSFGEFVVNTSYNSVSAIIVAMQDGFIFGRTKEEAEEALKRLQGNE